MKKLFAIILALAMTFALSAAALAETQTPAPAVTEGTITIQNPVNGKKYEAYRIFDLTYTPNPGTPTNYSYTIQKKIGDANNPWFDIVENYAKSSEETDTDGLTLTVMPGDANTYAVTFTDDFDASTFAAHLKTNLPENATVNAQRKAGNPQVGPLQLTTNGEVPVTNPSEETPDNTKVPLGYYFVTSDLGTVCSLDSSSPNMVIFEKNTDGDTPGFDGTNGKTFGDSENGDASNSGSAQINDKLFYKIDAHVPEYLGSYPVVTYVFTDTLPKGLTLITDEGTIKATLYPGYTAPDPDADPPTSGSFTGTAKELTIVNATSTTENPQATYKITNNDDGTTTLEITVYPQNITGYYPDAYILLEYQATVDKDATFDNTNKVTLKWTLGDSGVTDPEEPKPTNDPEKPPETEAEVKVYGFILNKTNDATPAVTLDGALFKLLVNTAAAGAEASYEEVPLVLETGDHDPAVPTAATDVTSYYRVWTEGADGTKVDYTGDPLTDNGKKTFIQAGKVAIFGLDADKTYILREVKAPEGYNPWTADIEVKFIEETGVGADGWLDTEKGVINKSGTQLPSTGGIGTTIFYIVGGLLMVGAVVLLVVRKKMSVQE